MKSWASLRRGRMKVGGGWVQSVLLHAAWEAVADNTDNISMQFAVVKTSPCCLRDTVEIARGQI